MNMNKIITYSFLAHINNSSAGIKDFSDVFLPLVKSAISKLSDRGINKGESINEIKLEVDKLYKLDIPIPLLKKLVKKIADEENKKSGEGQFYLYSDDAFIIRDYVFSEHSELLTKQERDVNNINEAYLKFLKARNIPYDEDFSIFTFIDQNRASLSRYFATTELIQVEETEHDIINAEFIELLKRTNQIDFEVLRRIYLGSIIAGYLEIKIEDAKEDVEFVVDTNFIISLLDLTSQTSTHTCNKILEICKRLKHRVSVLDITIRETQKLLNAVATNIDTSFMEKRIDKESIYNACDRRNLERTDLQSISSSLIDSLAGLGLNIIHNTEKYENEARMTENLYQYFKAIRRSDFAALHDATAVIYVRKKRNKVVTSFYGANCWFVTNTSHNINHSKITIKGGIPELIRAEDLINILWLSNPAVPNVDMLEVGLTKLISNAYSESLPSARVLKEFDVNIRKYGQGVSQKEVIRVANAIANKTITNLEVENLNSLPRKSPEEFIRGLRDVAAREQTENEKRAKAVEYLFEKSEVEARERVLSREREVEERETKIREEAIFNLTTRLEIQHKNQSILNEAKINLKTDLRLLKELEKRKIKSEETAVSRTNKYLVLIGLLCIALSLTNLYFEPIRFIKDQIRENFYNHLMTITTAISYVLLLPSVLFMFMFFSPSKENLYSEIEAWKVPLIIKRWIFQLILTNQYESRGFELEEYNELKASINKNERIIKELN